MRFTCGFCYLKFFINNISLIHNKIKQSIKITKNLFELKKQIYKNYQI
jgi:hypothetical protein